MRCGQPLSLSFSPWEKVPAGRMREWTIKSYYTLYGTSFFLLSRLRRLRYPALRATFSRWEKGIKN